MLMANFRGLEGSAIIETLQRALANLAVAANRPGSNPGPITGVVNDATMVALSDAINLYGEELPDTLYLLLQAGLIAGTTSAKAKAVVTKYAAPLTIAINTAAIKAKPAAVPDAAMAPTTPGVFDTLFAPGWYMRPSLGLLIVGLGAFVGYKLLAPSAASRAA